MSDVLTGSLAGLTATAPMTAAMVAMHRRLPPRERYPLPPRQITDKLAEEAGVDDELSEPQRRATTRCTGRDPAPANARRPRRGRSVSTDSHATRRSGPGPGHWSDGCGSDAVHLAGSFPFDGSSSERGVPRGAARAGPGPEGARR